MYWRSKRKNRYQEKVRPGPVTESLERQKRLQMIDRAKVGIVESSARRSQQQVKTA